MPSFLLSAALFLAPATTLDDCDSCRPKLLCDVHRGELKEALRAFSHDWRSKEPAERIAALRAIAEQNARHANVPAEEVAEALAEGIADRDLEVRTVAAGLLGDGQQVAAAVGALKDGLKDLTKTMPSVGFDDEAYSGTMKLARTVVQSIGHYPDDAAVKALVRFLQDNKIILHGEVLEAVHTSLIGFGCRDAIEAVVDYQAEVEGYAGFGPKISRMIHDKLATAAPAWGFEDIPSWSGQGTGRAWRECVKANAKKLPKKIGDR